MKPVNFQDPLTRLLTIALANALTYEGDIEDAYSDWVQAGINDGKADEVTDDGAPVIFDALLEELEQAGFVTRTNPENGDHSTFTLDEHQLIEARKFWNLP